jgi:tetratricopeptide (TPR) repeat protein
LYNYYAGCCVDAFSQLDEGISVSRKAKYRWGVGISEFFKAWILFDQGKLEQSKKYFNSFYQYEVAVLPQYLFNHKADYAFHEGLIFAKQRKCDSARTKIKEIEILFPRLTPTAKERHSWARNFLYSQILIAEDSLEKALEVRNSKRSLDNPFGFVRNYMQYNFPISHDELAQAYIRHNQTDNAIKEYRYLIERDPYRREYRIINPRYHYQLAKLLQQTGEVEEAKKEYSRFLDIWKNADKDLPEYIDAQKQLDNLTAMAHK